MSLREKTEELRAEALRKARECPEVAQLIALDEAVAAMGGSKIVPALLRQVRVHAAAGRSEAKSHAVGHGASLRISQGDAAKQALEEHGEPVPITELMTLATEKGARIGGNKPIVSFRTMLSKDSRFYSLTKNNAYFWWLAGVDVPVEWSRSEARSSTYDLLAPDPILESEKGGDGHGSANT